MNEQLKRYIDPIIRFWKNLSKKKKIIILCCLIGIIAVAVVIELLLSMPSYVVLYPKLDQTEAVDVMNELDGRDIKYKESNGTIYVPKDQENALRMELANEGYPKSTLNYDFFTSNVNAMTTDSEQKIIEKYQLAQRLETIVKTFDSVQNASVNFTLSDQNTYAWDSSSNSSGSGGDANKSTASVTVTLKNGKTLDPSQVNGIKQLVSKSVPNLSPDDVSVIDTATGKVLDSSDTTAGTAVDISEFKRTIEKEYEDDVVANASKVLSKLYGQGNFEVSAKSVMDVDKKVSEILTYLPSADNKGVTSSETIDKEAETGTTTAAGGAAGTQTNTETTPNYSGVTVDGNTIYTKDQETYQYLVSQTKEQIQGDAASLKDMTISVVINRDSMSDVDKAGISQLVANAAAIDPSKVAVYNSAFAVPNTPADTGNQPKGSPLNFWFYVAGAAAIGILMLFVLFFWILSSSRKKKLRMLLMAQETEEMPEQESDETVEMSEAEDESAKERKALEAIRTAQQSREKELREDLQEFSSQNPEIVAQLIRTWVRGDDNDA